MKSSRQPRKSQPSESDRFTDPVHIRPRLPHNLEAEKSVLGAILIDPAQLDVAAGIVSPRDFFRKDHGLILERLIELSESGAAVDLIGLKDLLYRKGELDDIGGPAYLASLTDGIPRSANVDHYARIVKEKKALRSLVYYAQNIIEQVTEGDEGPAALIEQADRALIDIAGGHQNGRMASLADTSTALFHRMDHRANNRGLVSGLPTGYPVFDQTTMGLQPGELWIIAARPSIGKTTFAMNVATNAARAQKRGAVFSLEMTREQLEDRMIASLSDIEHQQIVSGYLGERDYAKLSPALGIMHDLTLWIDDTTRRSAPAIRRACRRLKNDGGLDFVVVDYLQLMPSSLDYRGTRDEQLDDICQRLKDLGKELRVPVILLSQLNRDSQKREDSRPQLSDLRGSGAIEQHADGVLFLHRENYREGGFTLGIIAKQRNGPTGSIGLSLCRETLLFTPCDKKPDSDEKKPKKSRKAKEAQVDLIPAPSHQPEE